MKQKPEFRLQLTHDEALRCAGRYDAKVDESAMEAGRRIASGEFSPDHLATIYKWKTRNRGKSRLNRNLSGEVQDALRLALAAREPRSAIAVLLGLYGVGTPVASAVATVIHPDLHTILDFRALEALGSPSTDRSIGFYLEYLRFCRELAAAWQMPLRTLDRALWQWSKDRTPNRDEEG